MPLLPSASDVEPILILTDQDYRRAFAPDPGGAPVEAGRVSGKAVETRVRPRRSKPWLGAAALLSVVVAVGLWMGIRPGPAPEPPAALAPAPPPPPPEPARVPVAAARIRSAPAPSPVAEAEAEETPKAAVPISGAPNRGAWFGGRAWVQVHLRLDQAGRMQDLRRRAVLSWDGTQFVVKPQGGARTELWMDRLQLLLNLPWAGDAVDREVSSTTKTTLSGEVGVFECDRVEGVDRFPQQVRAFAYWISPEFPAGALQARVSFPELSMELRVLGYGPEPGGE